MGMGRRFRFDWLSGFGCIFRRGLSVLGFMAFFGRD